MHSLILNNISIAYALFKVLNIITINAIIKLKSKEVIKMKRKNQLMNEIKNLEKEIKSLSDIIIDDSYVPSEDEIHGWAIRSSVAIENLTNLRDNVLEFYRN